MEIRGISSIILKMKTSVLTFFLCAVLVGVAYSAIVAGKSLKNVSLQARKEVAVNYSSGQFAQVSLQPVDNMGNDFE